MNFDFTSDDQMLQQAVREAVDKDYSGKSEDPGDARVALAALLKDLAPTGYLDLALTDAPAAVSLTAAMEALAEKQPALFLAAELSTRGFGRLIYHFAGEALRSEMLPRICEGSIVGAVAFGDAGMDDSGSEPPIVGTEEGDRVRISGKKPHVLGAGAADWLAVAGRFGEDPAVFLVARDAPGLAIASDVATETGSGAGLWNLVFTDCAIPRAHVILPQNSKRFMETLHFWENQVLCASALGDMVRTFGDAKAFAQTRHSGGKPLIARQAVAFKLAEMFTLLQTGRLLAYRAGEQKNNPGREDFTLMYCAKVFCTEASEKIASEAMEILGTGGLAPEHPAMASFLRSKIGAAFGAPTEVARDRIGDAMMRYIK